MALNFLAPSAMKLFYTVSGIEHVSTVPLNNDAVFLVGTADNQITLRCRDNSTRTFATFVDAWVGALRPFYAPSSTFTRAEYWQYIPATNEGSFITSRSLNLAGTDTDPTVLAGQTMYTFRTLGGGIMKINLLESTIDRLTQLSFSQMSAGEQTITNLVIAGNSPILGRDGYYPIAFNKVSSGKNEKLFRIRYR